MPPCVAQHVWDNIRDDGNVHGPSTSGRPTHLLLFFYFLFFGVRYYTAVFFFLSFVIVFQRYRFFWFYELNESSTSRKWLFFSLFRFDSRSFFAQKRKEETSGFMCVCVLYRWVLLSSNSFLAGHCRVPYTLISFLSIGSPLLGCNVI